MVKLITKKTFRYFFICMLFHSCIHNPNNKDESEFIYDYAETYVNQYNLPFAKGIIIKSLANRTNKTNFIVDTALVTYKIVNDVAVFQGDIKISPIENYDVKISSFSEEQMRFVGRPGYIWYNNTVRYKLGPGMRNAKALIKSAMKKWEIATNGVIKFKEINIGTGDYVLFVADNGGYLSEVGMKGGKQEVRMPRFPKEGHILHELGHVIGLWHEQGRLDRDKYVTVIKKNIYPKEIAQFDLVQVHDSKTYGIGYDYNSVMHYGRYAFSKNGLATIIPKDNSAIIGNRASPSKSDVAGVLKLYTN